MKLLLLLFVAIYAVACFSVITQIIAPAYSGRPLFPMFRRKSLELEQQLASVLEDRDLKAAKDRVKQAKQGVIA